MENFTNLVFVFCTLPFVVFFNAFLKNKSQNFVVLIFSLFFLCWVSSVKVVILLVLLTSAVQGAAVLICKFRSKRLRFGIFLFMVFLILVLIFFAFGFIFSKVFSNLFFDFERILFLLVCMANVSYLIDVYKEYAELQKSFLNMLMYVFMFPKLFLGPVLIYYKFKRQLVGRKIDFDLLSEGIEFFIIGFAKKIVFANELYEIYSFVISQTFSSLPVLTAWLGAFAGFLSLILNFSAYNDMSVGLGKMLGFNFPLNVKKIVVLNGVGEFFRNFNCLVINYFKNYIFPWIRKSSLFCRFLKLMLIGFFMAIFFGGNFECYVTASYFVVIVFLEKILINVFDVVPFKSFTNFLTLILLLIGTVLFQKCGINNNLNYLSSMFGNSGILVDFSFIFLVMLLKFFVIVFIMFFFHFLKSWFKKIKFFNLIYYLKFFGLIIIFLFSVLISLSQI